MAPTPRALFDARLHPAALSDVDLETLAQFGVRAGLVVADATALDRTAKELIAHLDATVAQVVRLRARGFGCWAALGVPPLALPRRGFLDVVDAIAPRCTGGRVVALGQLGLVTGAKAELSALEAQLALARRLRLKAQVTVGAGAWPAVFQLALQALARSGVRPRDALVECTTVEEARLAKRLGHFVGLTLHPDRLRGPDAVDIVRALGPTRLVAASAAGDGATDLLAVPKLARLLERAGLSAEVVDDVCQTNAATWLKVRVE